MKNKILLASILAVIGLFIPFNSFSEEINGSSYTSAGSYYDNDTTYGKDGQNYFDGHVNKIDNINTEKHTNSYNRYDSGYKISDNQMTEEFYDTFYYY